MTKRLTPLQPVVDFIRLVWRMREAQCTYYAARNLSNLLAAKDLEKRVDQELGAYLAVLDKPGRPSNLDQFEAKQPEEAEQADLHGLEQLKQGRLC